MSRFVIYPEIVNGESFNLINVGEQITACSAKLNEVRHSIESLSISGLNDILYSFVNFRDN